MQEEEMEAGKPPENTKRGRTWARLGKQESIQLMQVDARKPETWI